MYNKKDVVIKYRSRFWDIDKIGLVGIDMWNLYKNGVNSMILHTKIVINKFYVVKLSNEVLKKIR